jgi:hypothetical protein
MRLWFFPLRSVSVGPFNSVAQSFSALPPDRGLSGLRNDGKASANGRERINRNGIVRETCPARAAFTQAFLPAQNKSLY